MEITKEVTISLNEKEMNAIEDAFFVHLDCYNEEAEKIQPLLEGVWKKLCKEMNN